MDYGATKLVYSDGKPLWLTPEGNFVPVRREKDGTISGKALFIRDRSRSGALRLISR